MDKIALIAGTAFRETLRKKVSYIVLFLALLIVALLSLQMIFINMAEEAGETELLSNFRLQIVSMTLGLWNFAALFLALFLGAVAISSEIHSKTIVNVLARPIARWQYMAGRWSGTLLYLLCFIAIGIALALIFVAYFDVNFSPLFWVGIVDLLIALVFYSGVSMGLSTFAPPVVAGGLALLIAVMPALAGGWIDNPRIALRALGMAGYYLGPAKLPIDPLSESFSKQLLTPNYALYIQVLLENLLYSLLIFAIGCVIFTKRELRLRG